MLVSEILHNSNLESQIYVMLYDTISNDTVNSVTILEIDYDFLFKFSSSFLENKNINISTDTLDSILRQCIEYFIFEAYNNFKSFKLFVSKEKNEDYMDSESDSLLSIIVYEAMMYGISNEPIDEILIKNGLLRLFTSSSFIEFFDGISNKVMEYSEIELIIIPFKWVVNSDNKYRTLSLACYS